MAASQTADIVRLHLGKISFQRGRLQHHQAGQGGACRGERESSVITRPGGWKVPGPAGLQAVPGEII